MTDEIKTVTKKNAPRKKTTVKKAVTKPVTKPSNEPKMYKNTGKRNLFTEDGRCMPGETVNLTAEQAKSYKGLSKHDK